MNEQTELEIHWVRARRSLSAGVFVFMELGVPPSQHIDVFSHLESLQALYFGDFYGDFSM